MKYLEKKDYKFLNPANLRSMKAEAQGNSVSFTYLPPNILGLFDRYKREIQIREAEDHLTKLEVLIHELEHSRGKGEFEARICTEIKFEKLLGLPPRFQLPGDYKIRSKLLDLGYD